MSSHDYNRWRVDVDGGRLSIGVWEPVSVGPGPVPTVCAIHGITSNHLFFAGLVPRLPGVRVIGPDLRGRADSRLLEGPFGMRAHAEDVLTVIESFPDSGPVVLVGHSMGGFVAMTLAGLPAVVGDEASPDLAEAVGRFRGPVLIDGGLPLPTLPTEAAGAEADGVDPALDTDDLIAAVLGPAAERLSMTFTTVEEYLAFFAAHPAFVDGLDTVATESFVYDLAAKDDDSFQPSTSVEAMQADSADMYTGTAYPRALDAVMGHRQAEVTFLSAERDLVAAEPGLYPPELVADFAKRWPLMHSIEVLGTNHYDILLTEAGLDACAQAVRERLGAVVGGAVD